MEDIYTSTGVKLLHHPIVLMALKNKRALPISLQVGPTSRCNLNCVFCSNVNRSKHEDLDDDDLYNVIDKLCVLGLNTIEWTGGGDPTLWTPINEMIHACEGFFHLKQGFITNGVALVSKINPAMINMMSWLRISMNCLDYVENIEMPKNFQGTLGFSYVMNDKTHPDTLARLHEYVKKYNPKYVRIVPNCQATEEQQEKNNKLLSELVADWGQPYFYQAKHFEKPKYCYWGYLKPFLLHDQFVYRCSSVVLNDDAGRYFHEQYRWCKMEDLPSMYDKDIESGDPSSCNHCVFTKQNDLVSSILHPNGMEDFV